MFHAWISKIQQKTYTIKTFPLHTCTVCTLTELIMLNSIMLNSYQFDIIAVTEMWLQDTECQRDYVQVTGYNTAFKNWTGKRGDGVGFYLKEQLKYKVRADFTQNYTDLEILAVEICVRNKKTPTLVCAVYQPSSIEVEKLEWLEKFEQFLANIYTTSCGVLIVTGDFNVNLLSHQNESTVDSL